MYKEKIVELLKNNMTEKGFKLWEAIDIRLPNIWELPTSSTGKWHQKKDGTVPTNAEHVYHMLYAASKIIRMFDYKPKTNDVDKVLLAIVLHDSLKYGNLGTRAHTDNKHDKNAADMIYSNKQTFLKILNEDQFDVLHEAVRFHSGRWSSDVPKNNNFNFKDYNQETLMIHILDMLSTHDCIQTDMGD